MEAAVGIYSDIFNGGRNPGAHCFDADGFFAALGATDAQLKDDPSGEEAEVRVGGVKVIDKVLIHRNGDTKKDLATNVVVIAAEKLAALSDAQQAALVNHERVPRGENPANPGRRPAVSKPPRTVNAEVSDGADR